MGEFRLRDTRKLYPSAISEIVQPLPGWAYYTWKEVCAACMGSGGTGWSGAIVNGKLICDAPHSELNAWLVGVP